MCRCCDSLSDNSKDDETTLALDYKTGARTRGCNGLNGTWTPNARINY
jgi:hypothetical protein